MNWGKLPPTPACIIMLMMIINGLKGKGRFIVHTHIYIYMFINQASDSRRVQTIEWQNCMLPSTFSFTG